jgi:hypothetical protein
MEIPHSAFELPVKLNLIIEITTARLGKKEAYFPKFITLIHWFNDDKESCLESRLEFWIGFGSVEEFWMDVESRLQVSGDSLWKMEPFRSWALDRIKSVIEEHFDWLNVQGVTTTDAFNWIAKTGRPNILSSRTDESLEQRIQDYLTESLGDMQQGPNQHVSLTNVALGINIEPTVLRDVLINFRVSLTVGGQSSKEISHSISCISVEASAKDPYKEVKTWVREITSGHFRFMWDTLIPKWEEYLYSALVSYLEEHFALRPATLFKHEDGKSLCWMQKKERGSILKDTVDEGRIHCLSRLEELLKP